MALPFFGTGMKIDQVITVLLTICVPLSQKTDFPGGSGVKNILANEGDTKDAGLISGSRRSPGFGNDTPLRYPCLENFMDKGV